MRPVDLGLFEALPLRYVQTHCKHQWKRSAKATKKLPVRHHLKHATGPEQGRQLECFHRPFGKKTVEKKLTLQSISLLEPKRSKLWDFVFNGEASRA